MAVTDIIDQFYSSLSLPNINNSDKAEIYYNIIYTKNAEGLQNIYVDVKKFLDSYLQSTEEKSFGYDRLDSQKIVTIISLLTIEERINIWEFLKKLCVRYQSEELWQDFETYYYEAKQTLLTASRFWYFNPVKIANFFYFKTICSYLALLTFLFVILIIEIVVLLPNRYGWASVFVVEYEPIADTFWKNHVVNVTLSLLEFDNDFKVLPLNMFGTVILILSKIFKVIFLVKYLVDRLVKKISFDEQDSRIRPIG